MKRNNWTLCRNGLRIVSVVINEGCMTWHENGHYLGTSKFLLLINNRITAADGDTAAAAAAEKKRQE